MIGEKIALLNQLSSPSSPTSFVHLDTSNPRNGISLRDLPSSLGSSSRQQQDRFAVGGVGAWDSASSQRR